MYDRSALQQAAIGHASTLVRARSNEALGIALLVLSGVVLLASVLRAATSFSAVRAYELAMAEGRDPAQVVTVHDLVGVLWLVIVPTWIVGSLWLSRARQNAALIAPGLIRRSAGWAWFGWVVPIVCLFFPKQMVDDCWRITSDAIPVPVPGAGPRSRYHPTALWWGLWLVFNLMYGIGNRLNTTGGLSGTDPHQGVVPLLEIATAIVGILAFAAWVRVVLGLSRAQTELAGPAPW
jgi:hypothetical protein